MTYKANSKEDVKLLAQRIRDTPTEDRCQLIADCVFLGLMYINDPYTSDTLEVMKKHNQENAVFMFFNLYEKLNPGFIDSFIEDVYNHIVNGKDTVDQDSVGGWSQREIDTFLIKRGWNENQ